MNQTLIQYIQTEIIPQYAGFDKAHREDHARAVIERALAMGENIGDTSSGGKAGETPGASHIDLDMLYTAAACHDLGLAVDRKTHHLESGRIIRADKRLLQWFTPEQIETIAQAAEDHRASATTPPRSIYGALVAEADRMIVPETIIRRTVQFGLSHYPSLDKEGHWQRTLEHLHEKYAEGGYLHLLIPGSPNEEPLRQLRAIIHDTPRLRRIFDAVFASETPGT
ncbi:MAG: HD domain-containing protein [Bacteroidales bacterium]|nr:HD domain-containing protein [Bacteroidales bacterium]